ncbi:hypothetical protein BDQ12DRAFT_671329 [Crucibulum laeve]|uniref:Uncharacterized protein n=1 Tax=Crucibulum laeve TaxID=68775 RepID=A0A5C3LHF7_9AGAR|nr:hypothetical protein BDQ12DRAFT_671329 [Crucibulum laeve]
MPDAETNMPVMYTGLEACGSMCAVWISHKIAEFAPETLFLAVLLLNVIDFTIYFFALLFVCGTGAKNNQAHGAKKPEAKTKKVVMIDEFARSYNELRVRFIRNHEYKL